MGKEELFGKSKMSSEIEDLIRLIDEHDRDLGSSATLFESLVKQFENTGSLSPKQISVLKSMLAQLEDQEDWKREDGYEDRY